MATSKKYPELELDALMKCKGYDARFIDGKINIDILKPLTKEAKNELPLVEGNKKGVLNYSNLSVCYHSGRKAAYFAAYNIDGDKEKLGSRPSFRKDPRLDEALQLDKNNFYKLGNDFEIGHLCANNEMSWGNDARTQTLRTFFFTNSVPQTERLNVGLWRSLETYIIDQTQSATNNNKICVFTGPVLKPDDPVLRSYNNYQLPIMFYKVIIFEFNGKLYSTAFIISHSKRIRELNLIKTRGTKGIESVQLPFDDYSYKKIFQVDMSLLNKETGLKFEWKNINPIVVPNQKNQIKKILDTDSADDAKKIIKDASRGNISKDMNTSSSVSTDELKNKRYYLNLILP